MIVLGVPLAKEKGSGWAFLRCEMGRCAAVWMEGHIFIGIIVVYMDLIVARNVRSTTVMPIPS